MGSGVYTRLSCYKFRVVNLPPNEKYRNIFAARVMGNGMVGFMKTDYRLESDTDNI